jgi:hypothetical protein
MIRKSVRRFSLATNAKRVCAEIMLIAELANGVLHDDAEFGIRTPAAKEAAFRSPLSLPTKGVVAFGHYWKSRSFRLPAAWAIRIWSVIPAAPRSPATPGHIVLLGGVGISSLVRATGWSARIRLTAGMGEAVLRQSGRCEYGS